MIQFRGWFQAIKLIAFNAFSKWMQKILWGPAFQERLHAKTWNTFLIAWFGADHSWADSQRVSRLARKWFQDTYTENHRSHRTCRIQAQRTKEARGSCETCCMESKCLGQGEKPDFKQTLNSENQFLQFSGATNTNLSKETHKTLFFHIYGFLFCRNWEITKRGSNKKIGCFVVCAMGRNSEGFQASSICLGAYSGT